MEFIEVDPLQVLFSQCCIRPRFKNGKLVEDTIKMLVNGKISPKDIELIHVCILPNGKMHSLDNRRLYAFKEAVKRGSIFKTVTVIKSNKLHTLKWKMKRPPSGDWSVIAVKNNCKPEYPRTQDTAPLIIPQSTFTVSSQLSLVRQTLHATVGATTKSSKATTKGILTSSTRLKVGKNGTKINRKKKDLVIENTGRIVRLEEKASKADLLRSKIDSNMEVKFSKPVLDSTRPLDKQRKKSYDIAEEINQDLSTIITGNRNIIKSPVGDELNEKLGELDQEVTQDPMDEIMKSINLHLASLQLIANRLTQDIQNAQQLVIQAQDELSSHQQQNGSR